MNARTRGNLSGIGALLMWSAVMGLFRSITDSFGVVAGTALIYTMGAIATFLKNGIPNLRKMPKSYLFGVGAIFVLYEIAYSQSIGLAETPQQTLEVGMLNCLWPCLTIVFSLWINHTKLYWWVWPGVIISIVGLYVCVTADSGLDILGFFHNFLNNPIPYSLGLWAGISWALYSNLSLRFSKGHNAVSLFFSVIALILWAEFFLRGEELHVVGFIPCFWLLIVGLIMGISYSMWESGIHNGNFILIAICSYFMPALTMIITSLLLHTLPPAIFWAGVGLVIGGSLICWLASLKKI